MRQNFKIIESNLARCDLKPITNHESIFCKNYLTINHENRMNYDQFPADL
jgi:hypothetical protein